MLDEISNPDDMSISGVFRQVPVTSPQKRYDGAGESLEKGNKINKVTGGL